MQNDPLFVDFDPSLRVSRNCSGKRFCEPGLEVKQLVEARRMWTSGHERPSRRSAVGVCGTALPKRLINRVPAPPRCPPAPKGAVARCAAILAAMTSGEVAAARSFSSSPPPPARTPNKATYAQRFADTDRAGFLGVCLKAGRPVTPYPCYGSEAPRPRWRGCEGRPARPRSEIRA